MSRRESANVLTLNPAATATTVTAAVTAFLLACWDWAASAVPDSVPQGVKLTAAGLIVLGIGAVAHRIGRFAQRWTYPAVEDPAIVALGEPALPPPSGQTDRRAGQMIRPTTGDLPDITGS